VNSSEQTEDKFVVVNYQPTCSTSVFIYLFLLRKYCILAHVSTILKNIIVSAAASKNKFGLKMNGFLNK
jgi:hypothetical protein